MAPIHDAARNGDLEEVERLIQEDPEVVHSREADGFGSTPLQYASRKGHARIAACLLGHGAHIDQVDDGGWTACLVACIEGQLSVLELLLEKGANPITRTYDGSTPLMWASMKGHEAIVDRLLHHPQAMATLDHRDVGGSTALFHACWKGRGVVVRRLLEAGADPTVATHDDISPMAMARYQGREDCVMLLEEWERRYLLTKARHLHDAASLVDDVTQSLAHHPSSSSTSTVVTCGQVKQTRIKATPAYLQERVEKKKPLPKVEVAGGGGVEVDRSVREMDRGLLVKVVLEHVVCGGLRGELFVELMEVMGRTGDWKAEEEEQVQQKEKEGTVGRGQEEGGRAASSSG